MASHLYEFAGITLHVDYAMDPDDLPNIQSVRVLGADYQPCGPDLCDLLVRLVFMHSPTHGEAMMSVIVGDLYSALERH